MLRLTSIDDPAVQGYSNKPRPVFRIKTNQPFEEMTWTEEWFYVQISGMGMRACMPVDERLFTSIVLANGFNRNEYLFHVENLDEEMYKFSVFKGGESIVGYHAIPKNGRGACEATFGSMKLLNGWSSNCAAVNEMLEYEVPPLMEAYGEYDGRHSYSPTRINVAVRADIVAKGMHGSLGNFYEIHQDEYDLHLCRKPGECVHKVALVVDGRTGLPLMTEN